MKVFAIDTANWAVSLALWENDTELAFIHQEADRSQTALLPLLAQDMLGTTKIDQLLVNVGPGSFTGIRLGIAFAKGLAKGLGIPLSGFDSFMATYINLPPKANQIDVLVLVDAHRKDMYGRKFIKGNPQSPQTLTVMEIEKMVNESPLYLSGERLDVFLKGIHYEELPCALKGAQRLAHGFFTHSHLSTSPQPFYAKEADVTLPSSPTC